MKQTKPESFYNQSAALPYRFSDGIIEILLITSLKRKNWIIPKGIIEPNMSASKSACKEAFEEAGVSGIIDSSVFAVYEIKKWGGICRIKVFPMKIQEEFTDWPERFFRQRRWFKIEEAVSLVAHAELKGIIRKLHKKLSNK